MGLSRPGRRGRWRDGSFFTTAQVEQLALPADDAQVDSYAVRHRDGLSRPRLFPGSARLFELADEVLPG
jgi:thymidine kinase